MLNLVSLLLALVTFIFLVVTFLFPFIGAIGAWLSLVAAIFAAGIGQLSTAKSGRNFALFVVLVALLRLFIGGGVL